MHFPTANLCSFVGNICCEHPNRDILQLLVLHHDISPHPDLLALLPPMYDVDEFRRILPHPPIEPRRVLPPQYGHKPQILYGLERRHRSFLTRRLGRRRATRRRHLMSYQCPRHATSPISLSRRPRTRHSMDSGKLWTKEIDMQ